MGKGISGEWKQKENRDHDPETEDNLKKGPFLNA